MHAPCVHPPDSPLGHGMFTTRTISNTLGGFRMTRGGRIFSPWVSEMGLPIYAPAEFNLEEHCNAALPKSQEMAADADDLAVGTPPPSSLVSSAMAALDNVDTLTALDALPDSHSAPPQPNRKPSPPSTQPTPTLLSSPSTACSANATAKAKSKKSSHERRRVKRLA
ncbi:hypothetical protein LXA43DRAFT_1101174 [Ganoderma leucocontextum]|nr:hypothetical protein LXA43DRAFT_1101174 [Ganoderma leucocontextum]